jgi:hypothetical protein
VASAQRGGERSLRIAVPIAGRRRRRWVVEAEVEGSPLWFACSDARLEPCIEAFTSALLIPAAERGMRLEAPVSASALWLRRHVRRRQILERWWQLVPPEPALPPATAARGRPRRETGLCFGGGVDSLHALRVGGRRIDAVVTVLGYDVALGDAERCEHAERSARAVAAAAGVKAIVVRTNLREHPAFTGADWERAHGGALAAVGHLLTRRIGRLLVAASYPYDHDAPWGSHWLLDSLWSSEVLEVAHVGAELWRGEKLRELVDDPLARRHLRVCWENLAGAFGNCGRCEKCIRTMLVLEQTGWLHAFEVFDQEEPLADRVLALGAIPEHLVPIYSELLRRGLPQASHRAVRELLGWSTQDPAHAAGLESRAS